MRSRHRKGVVLPDVPARVRRVLNLILIAQFFIILRIWHLAEVQYESKIEEAKKPRHRVVLEPASRGTIRDRFNLPLAINKIQYQAGIVYADFKEIPRIAWTTDASGKKVKRYKRKEYIANLSRLVGNELGIDPQRIEDLIHAKAAFYYQMPFILSEDISEEVYYRLNMLSKDWPGLYVTRAPKRTYPRGRLAADVIGYLGAINSEEYLAIMQEIACLEAYVASEESGEAISLPDGFLSSQAVRQRLKDLSDWAYSRHDSVGKLGVEARFEELLRGLHGRKTYYSDARGNFLRELPGSLPPCSGTRLLLSVSSELQEYAEMLLAKSEAVRQMRTSTGAAPGTDPFVRGGAIVALDPMTGQVVALASFPRFDPNDFIARGPDEEKREKSLQIKHWFETEEYLAEVWDRKRPLEREVYQVKSGRIEIETKDLTWNDYLSFILPSDNPVLKELRRIGCLKNGYKLLLAVERLQEIAEQEVLYPLFNEIYHGEDHFTYGNPLPAHELADMQERLERRADEVSALKKQMDRWFSAIANNYDKVMLLDLLRLVINTEIFDDRLITIYGQESLAEYREMSGSVTILQDVVKEMVRGLFHELYFVKWREEKGNAYLREKRQIEKETKAYAKPYIDYFDRRESELFTAFWNRYKWRFMTVFFKGRSCIEEVTPYDDYLLTWHDELEMGAHGRLPWVKAYRSVADRVKHLDGADILAYMQTFRSLNDLTRPLLGSYKHIRKDGGRQLEKHLAMAFYPKYGFGNARSFAYRQTTTQGSIFKLVTAYAALAKKWELLGRRGSWQDLNPLTIVDEAFKSGGKQYVGYTDKGLPIPQLYNGGRLMRTLIQHAGKIDLVKALEVSSNPYFSLLAADVIGDSALLLDAARALSYGGKTGIDLPYEIAGRLPNDLDINKTGLYSFACGQHSMIVTPLQTAVMLAAIANGGYVLKPSIVRMVIGSESQGAEAEVKVAPVDVVRQIEMPPAIQKMLLEGMRRVILRQTTQGLGSLTRLYEADKRMVDSLVDLKDYLIGKTSTAESTENLNLDLYRGTNTYNHCWFAGISYREPLTSGFLPAKQMPTPELVVVVFLRYGSYGKDAAPLAADLIKKWREISSRS